MIRLLESETKYKDIILRVRDEENHIEDLLNYIKSNTDPGHCSTIIVDADGDDYKKSFQVDGDGIDRIVSINVKGVDNDD